MVNNTRDVAGKMNPMDVRVLESALRKSVDDTGLTTLEAGLGLAAVSGTGLLTLVTAGGSVTLS